MKRIVLILALGVSVAIAAAGFADTNSDAKKQIQAVSDKAMILIQKQDFKALAKSMQQDGLYTSITELAVIYKQLPKLIVEARKGASAQ